MTHSSPTHTTPTLSNDDLTMFFDDHHDEISAELHTFAAAWSPESYQDGWLATRAAVRQLAGYHLLELCVPERDGGRCINNFEHVDTRALTLTRECLGYIDGILDKAFAAQCLGSLPITLAGTAEQRARYLPDMMSGARIGAFALNELGAHDDISHVKARAKREEGGDYLITGAKSLVINAGVASQYVVFATTDARKRAQGITAFIVEASKPQSGEGSRDHSAGDNHVQVEPREMITKHPVGSLTLRRTRIPMTRRLGEEGQGLEIAREAITTLRVTTAGAALGMARRALDEALRYAAEAKHLGAPLVNRRDIASELAQSATELDAARLLVYRAAYLRDMRDVFGSDAIREVAMAKLYATEAAQRIIDRAIQVQGELGLQRGSITERLYREIRALRLHEGSSEMLQDMIARQLSADL